jgi:hypothetical protein
MVCPGVPSAKKPYAAQGFLDLRAQCGLATVSGPMLIVGAVFGARQSTCDVLLSSRPHCLANAGGRPRAAEPLEFICFYKFSYNILTCKTAVWVGSEVVLR